ncbi:hypothetical protein [Paenibacillus sp. UNC496MF]|uniref:hypothetical protein n=1 Tax=Paenibacillus sp. UNC496MF TaxID=1502753 RepID=UPI000B88C777|nr:hypothetical protein [Paenibacillus sp. UNC496MF]
MALMMAAGCGSAPNRDDAAANSGSAAGAESPVPAKFEMGQDPLAAAGIEDRQAFLEVFRTVKAAIAKDDMTEVANHILYPLKVNGADGKHRIQTRRDFIDQYKSIMTKEVRDAIANQDEESLFAYKQGVMIGSGELWFGASADSEQVIGLIAVNHDIGRK